MLQTRHHRHATATVAAGVAEAIAPDATIESVVETMSDQSTGLDTRSMDIALGYA